MDIQKELEDFLAKQIEKGKNEATEIRDPNKHEEIEVSMRDFENLNNTTIAIFEEEINLLSGSEKIRLHSKTKCEYRKFKIECENTTQELDSKVKETIKNCTLASGSIMKNKEINEANVDHLEKNDYSSKKKAVREIITKNYIEYSLKFSDKIEIYFSEFTPKPLGDKKTNTKKYVIDLEDGHNLQELNMPEMLSIEKFSDIATRAFNSFTLNHESTESGDYIQKYISSTLREKGVLKFDSGSRLFLDYDGTLKKITFEFDLAENYSKEYEERTRILYMYFSLLAAKKIVDTKKKAKKNPGLDEIEMKEFVSVYNFDMVRLTLKDESAKTYIWCKETWTKNLK